MTMVAIVATLCIPSVDRDAVPEHDRRLDHAELAIVAGGTVTDA